MPELDLRMVPDDTPEYPWNDEHQSGVKIDKISYEGRTSARRGIVSREVKDDDKAAHMSSRTSAQPSRVRNMSLKLATHSWEVTNVTEHAR